MTKTQNFPTQEPRARRGKAAQARGVRSEAMVSAALMAEGWQVLGQRVRTEAGEIDLIVTHEGLLVFVEVKSRPDLASAAWALGARQRARLLLAAEIWMGTNPGHGARGVRFDVLLVDPAGQMRRVMDAFRDEGRG